MHGYRGSREPIDAPEYRCREPTERHVQRQQRTNNRDSRASAAVTAENLTDRRARDEEAIDG
jgi:hypothetical protein